MCHRVLLYFSYYIRYYIRLRWVTNSAMVTTFITDVGRNPPISLERHPYYGLWGWLSTYTSECKSYYVYHN